MSLRITVYLVVFLLMMAVGANGQENANRVGGADVAVELALPRALSMNALARDCAPKHALAQPQDRHTN